MCNTRGFDDRRVLNDTQFYPQSGESKQEANFELPSWIKLSLEDSSFIEHEAGKRELAEMLDHEQEAILEQLKEVLTGSQYELLTGWHNVVSHHISRTYEGVYHAGARIGIRLAKQIESL